MTKKRTRWTPGEIQLLKMNYHSMNGKELIALFPKHSLSSIRSKAYDLGLTYTRPLLCGRDGLIEMYLHQRLSIREIARRYHVSHTVVAEALKKHGIDLQTLIDQYLLGEGIEPYQKV